MHGDKISRNRSLLLARWRGAASVADAREQAVVPVPALSDVSPADTATESKLASVSVLLERLEAEIRDSVPRATADALDRILAPVRAVVTSDVEPESCEAILLKLDLVEDILDAVLLAGSPAGDHAARRAGSEDAEKEREPP